MLLADVTRLFAANEQSRVAQAASAFQDRVVVVQAIDKAHAQLRATTGRDASSPTGSGRRARSTTYAISRRSCVRDVLAVHPQPHG